MRALLPILRALSEADVSFVVVGGVAVVLQGHPRMTVDLDLVLDLSAENAATAVRVLLDLGLRPRLPVDPFDFADEAVRATWIRERNLTVFSLHDPTDPRREVDLLARPPIPFAELHDDASDVELEDLRVPVASRTHLIAMKLEAGRPQDLVDAQALTELRGTCVAEESWDGGWAADRARKRRAWASLSATELLEWLEGALSMASEVGALERDRARRAADAAAWSQRGRPTRSTTEPPTTVAPPTWVVP